LLVSLHFNVLAFTYEKTYVNSDKLFFNEAFTYNRRATQSIVEKKKVKTVKNKYQKISGGKVIFSLLIFFKKN
jgi:hypothetical protein